MRETVRTGVPGDPPTIPDLERHADMWGAAPCDQTTQSFLDRMTLYDIEDAARICYTVSREEDKGSTNEEASSRTAIEVVK